MTKSPRPGGSQSETGIPLFFYLILFGLTSTHSIPLSLPVVRLDLRPLLFLPILGWLCFLFSSILLHLTEPRSDVGPRIRPARQRHITEKALLPHRPERTQSPPVTSSIQSPQWTPLRRRHRTSLHRRNGPIQREQRPNLPVSNLQTDLRRRRRRIRLHTIWESDTDSSGASSR